ncbi:MAG: nitroreductase family protein [Deltaproteobacteria bacterium]|nr:MAG: nitroreductase family protein [Deltaproteobacteria bacterium]
MLDTIKTRRSIRKFTEEDVDAAAVSRIIEMGTWAPSGHNNQPWRFLVIRDPALKEALSGLTSSGRIIREAPVSIAVFLDRDASYHRVKDIQAMGACIQNMLLAIHHMGLGGVWIGGILDNREAAERILGVPDACELMAVVSLGHPAQKKGPGSRAPLDRVILPAPQRAGEAGKEATADRG